MADLNEARFNAEDAISSGEGMAFLTLDGKNYPLFYAKKVEATATKNKSDIRVAGKRGIGHKTTSWSGEGTLTVYEVTSMFKELFVDYINSGVDRYFSLSVTNEDRSTRYGKETKVLTGCNFDKINIASFDGEDGLLEQELSFTFEGVELLEKFRG